ncbi:trypsin-like serine peptidase [Kocuria sp. NPDC057446]|uniref:trypsin-like serine peptidase n=1 Tax=Kocuria sp. NPDC057446 TaxID=3346137 RepID=UPI0036A41D7C
MSAEELGHVNPELLLQELRARAAGAGRQAPATARPRGPRAPVLPARELPRSPQLDLASDEDLVQALRVGQRVIYGTDDRQDVYQVTDTALLRDADSSVALVGADQITDNGDGTSTLNGPVIGDEYGLCADEPFRTQPTIAFCSGFLVDPSIVVTAGHCLDAGNLATTRFVFSYQMQDEAVPVTRLSQDEIRRGHRILGSAIGTEGTDWCVVQLDRPVLHHRHVTVRRTGSIADGAGVHVIGHPSGLPKKIAGGAVVRDNSPRRFFVANLDTYGGNSGSPVFDSATHVLEGILVRGETDYVQVGACLRSNVCPADGCRGEDVTRATEFAELVPENRHDIIPFDPNTAQVVQAGGRWKIEASGMWLLDFGSSRAEADRALGVITHYGLNAQGFVGRPDPSMEFYLVDGEAPRGSLPDEDRIGFDPATVEVRQVGGRWKLVDGDHWILDFGTSQAEARQALSYVLRYGFRWICFVGRPDPSMTYFTR